MGGLEQEDGRLGKSQLHWEMTDGRLIIRGWSVGTWDAQLKKGTRWWERRWLAELGVGCGCARYARLFLGGEGGQDQWGMIRVSE